MFRKMPVVLLVLISLVFLIESYIPLEFKQFIYAFGLTLKSLIILVLPFLIFMLLFKTMSRLSLNATGLVVFILAGVCISNFVSTMISYNVGLIVYQLDLSLALPPAESGLMPAWSFQFPKLISNDYAMFAGIASGILLPKISPTVSSRLSNYFEATIPHVLTFLTCIVPFFVFGFVVKLIHDDQLKSIFFDYSLIFLLIGAALIAYVILIYLFSSRFNIPEAFGKIKNMLPATITGFSTMSSAAAMPLTILGAEKNLPNSSLANVAIPLTVNTHLIGDCFAIPIFAFAVLKNFGAIEPSFYDYLLFAFYFVMAKFSVAAIPGGGIIVMLPILESHLGFTSEMGSLITALYILFDPFITCANVCGNGGFALLLNRIRSLVGRKETVEGAVA